VGRLREGLDDNVKMDLKGISYGCVDWINPAGGRKKWLAVVNTIMNLLLPAVC
jgi:hypothetical protein